MRRLAAAALLAAASLNAAAASPDRGITVYAAGDIARCAYRDPAYSGAADTAATVAAGLAQDLGEVAAEHLDLGDDALAAEGVGAHAGGDRAVGTDPGDALLLEGDRSDPFEQAHPVGHRAGRTPEVHRLPAGARRRGSFHDGDRAAAASQPGGEGRTGDATAGDQYATSRHATKRMVYAGHYQDAEHTFRASALGRWAALVL
jgi:hypothetical protein